MEQLLKARFLCDSDENYYPKDALHMYAENEPAIGRNEAVLNKLLVSFTLWRLMMKFQVIASTH